MVAQCLELAEKYTNVGKLLATLRDRADAAAAAENERLAAAAAEQKRLATQSIILILFVLVPIGSCFSSAYRSF